MFRSVLLVVAGIIAALLVYAGTRPDSFRLERSIAIKAPPEKIFPLVNDFRNWTAWSPWEKRDPAMKRSYSGPQSGPGAAYGWEGNKEVGSGRMEIAEASAPTKVRIKLDFIAPFEAHNTAEFTIAPGADASAVTWAMYGPQPYMAKLMSVFFSMDKMVGPDFEAGLANLKIAAEK